MSWKSRRWQWANVRNHFQTGWQPTTTHGAKAWWQTGILVLVAQHCAVKQRYTADSATELGNSTDTLGLLVKLQTPVPEDTRAGLNHRLADSMPSVNTEKQPGYLFPLNLEWNLPMLLPKEWNSNSYRMYENRALIKSWIFLWLLHKTPFWGSDSHFT